MGSIPIISTNPKFGQPRLGDIRQKRSSPLDGKGAESVRTEGRQKKKGERVNEIHREKLNGLIAQVVRARA